MKAIIFLTGNLIFIAEGLVYPLMPSLPGTINYLDLREVNSFILRQFVNDYEP
jgi:hypothetical protein